MCTISFLARQNGYALAMNRDENLSRAIGLPPVIKFVDGRAILSPAEPGGGTWISLNDEGITFALINWYAVTATTALNAVSRGKVVEGVGGLKSPAMATAILGRLPLAQINPFRLLGVFPDGREILEWQWDLQNLIQRRHAWGPGRWISSGFDEPRAQQLRGAQFQSALKQKTAGTLRWLRRAHRSHSPVVGAFSTCMHRADAATVSYTEVTVSPRTGKMSYFGGPPCRCVDGQLESCVLVRK